MNGLSVHSSQESAFAVLTPYLIPRALREKKVVNLGDGFILRAIERLIGRFAPARVFSSRVAPSDDAVKILEQCRGVILAGANQLKDSYTIWPGLTAECILKGALRFVPFGMGLHGQPSQNQGLSAETRAILQAVHARIEYSSWRCPRTVALLRRELPHLAGQFLMTGCPVLYDEPILESARFQTSEASVAVTATERNNFWDQETGVIDMVARRFPHARRYFVTHQNSSPPGAFEGVRHRLTHRSPSLLPDRVEALRLYARRRGFRIVIPRDAETCLRFYEGVDIHVGSRLHAHLLFLSRNKRSYLVPIDERAVGMAEHFGFPAGPPEHIEAIWECDFEVVRERARATFAVMDQFVRSVVKQP